MAFNNPTETLFNEANKNLANAAIHGFKQMAATMANLCLRGAAIFSDPLFRKNLGERFLSPFSMLGLWAVWLLTLWLSWFYGMAFTAYALRYFKMSGLADSASQLHWISVVALLGYGIAVRVSISNDLKAALRRHLEGRPTHTYSFGEPRFGTGQEIRVKIGLFILLLLAAAPLAAVYLASLYFSFLAGKLQEIEMYGRYLDTIDAMIETEQLETALLGVTPVGNTQLIKPLSARLPDSLRKNIAAAAARNTVMGLARPPKMAATNLGTTAGSSV
jgi:hypothetical protein